MCYFIAEAVVFVQDVGVGDGSGMKDVRKDNLRLALTINVESPANIFLYPVG